MTRRSSLQTVLRVAELRERVARGAAGADVAAERRTRADESVAEDRLAALPHRGDLRAEAVLGAWRAGAVLDARRESAAAAERSAASVAAYVAAARRTSLLAELLARKQAEHELATIAAEQRLADDLAGLRAGAGR